MPKTLLLLLALLVAATAAAATPAAPNATTLVLHTTRYQLARTPTNISWKEHLTTAGKPAGTSRINCTATTPTKLHCKGAYTLTAGTLYASATASQSTGNGKITGGTRTYTHATGTVRIVQLNDNGDSRTTITLHLAPPQ